MATLSRRRKNVNAISTIFFDLDNTLIPTKKGDKTACSKVEILLIEKYGLPSEEASAITRNFLKNFRKCPESSDVPLDDWRINLWRKALGEDYSYISEEVYLQWLRLRYEYLAPSEEVLTLLESLRKDYFLAVISNGKSNSQWEKITRLNLVPYFDCLIVSGDVPWEKPCKKIFFEACRHLGVSPENCIMVGDKIDTDILGAVEAGLAASVWIPLNERIFSHYGDVVPDFTIRDVTELVEVLYGIEGRSLFCPDFEDCNSNSSDGS